MTKNILLTATALGAIAFAGAAQAGQITTAKVSGASAGTTTAGVYTATPYKIASESTAATVYNTTTGATDNDITMAVATPLAIGSYLVRFDYTNIGGFQSVSLATTGAGGCTITPTLSSGGGASDTQVSYILTVGTAPCTTASLVLSAPFKTVGPKTVTVQGNLTQSGNPVDGGLTAARTLVSAVTGYTTLAAAGNSAADTVVDDADLVTRLLLGNGATPYTAFDTVTGDSVLGAIGYTVAANTFRDLISTALVAPDYTVTLNGSFTGLTATLGSGAACGTNTKTADTGGTASQVVFTGVSGTTLATSNVCVVASGTTTQLAGGAYTASFVPAALTGINTLASVSNASLETIGLEGTNFIAPWLQMQSSYTAVVRLSNIGATGTGPITLTLQANNGGTVNTTCTLTSAMLQSGTLVGGGIAANRSIEFTGKSLADNCFGTTSTNADLRVTIQGTSTNLTAKVRVINPGGVVVETSLGRLGESHASF